MREMLLNRLEECILFKGIPPKELDAMLLCLNPKTEHFKKNDYITIAGEPFLGIGVVISGQVAVTKEDIDGNRAIIYMLEPNDMFGEMAAFSDRQGWPATIISQTKSSVMFVSPEKIVGNCTKACQSHRKLILNMLEILSHKALMLNKKVGYLTIRGIREKICTYLYEEYKKAGKPIFMTSFNRNQLADFLNITRPSLSREMGRMRDEGIIDFHRSSIKILDIEALKRMARRFF